MRIIIVGAGEVGIELAKRFTHEKHDVLVLEKDLKKIEYLKETLDVLVIEEGEENIQALEQSGVKGADILIAATDTDEINIMTCLIAKKMSKIKTVARVRNPEYGFEAGYFSNEQLGIDYLIDPERLTAMEIAKLIKTPAVNDIETFAKGKIELLVFKVEKNHDMVGKKISALSQTNSYLIVAISRDNGEFIIPGGQDMILPQDNIYVLGKTGFLSEVGWGVKDKAKKVKNIMIFGGGRVGLKLAQILENDKKNALSIKIVEKCDERCREISKVLSRTLILNADGTDLTFLQEEDLSNIDVLVSVTGNDEINILSATLAKKLGVKKTIVKIDRSDYQFLIQTLDIDSFISPRLLIANKLIKLFRRTNILSETILREGKAEVLELVVPNNASIVNIPLNGLKLPKGILIGGIARKDKVIIPKGYDVLLPDDNIIVFTSPNLVNKVESIFSEGIHNKYLERW